MTVPRLAVLSKHWEKHPPLHTMVEAYFGIGESKQRSVASEDQNFDELMAQFPQKV